MALSKPESITVRDNEEQPEYLNLLRILQK